jgi:hypothetical protein
MERIKQIRVEVSPYYTASPTHTMSEVRLKVEIFGKEPLYLQRPIYNDDFESLFDFLLRDLKHETLRQIKGQDDD